MENVKIQLWETEPFFIFAVTAARKRKRLKLSLYVFHFIMKRIYISLFKKMEKKLFHLAM